MLETLDVLLGPTTGIFLQGAKSNKRPRIEEH